MRPLQYARKQPPTAFTFEVTVHIGDAGHRILHPYIKLEILTPSRSEYMDDLRSRRGDLEL